MSQPELRSAHPAMVWALILCAGLLGLGITRAGPAAPAASPGPCRLAAPQDLAAPGLVGWIYRELCGD